MEITGSRYSVTDWAIGLSAFLVFGVVALYAFLITLPTGWKVADWSLVLLGVVGTARLVLAVRKRRR